ncbi:hypothetical protein F441_03878 [Phytophthora nicotianae CJ01A1]|uniref:Uncharacterized protein n=1 Tax=Phytophthora nicotianae CJ01A1 TaxID=1317063 RepID=W2XJ62_PHYNI|nr:hypothetical protein F441_03878 [Phytophthora nicotianae CJ01A1]
MNKKQTQASHSANKLNSTQLETYRTVYSRRAYLGRFEALCSNGQHPEARRADQEYLSAQGETNARA